MAASVNVKTFNFPIHVMFMSVGEFVIHVIHHFSHLAKFYMIFKVEFSAK